MKIKIIITMLALIVLLIPSIVECSQDAVAEWKEANVTYDSGEKVAISLDTKRLQSLSLTLNNKKIIVPKEELQGIVLPLLESLYVSYNDFTLAPLQGVRYHVIHLRFESEAFGELPEVEFLFYKGRYQERRVRRKITATSWKHEVKKPGKPVERGGTERVVQ